VITRKANGYLPPLDLDALKTSTKTWSLSEIQRQIQTSLSVAIYTETCTLLESLSYAFIHSTIGVHIYLQDSLETSGQFKPYFPNNNNNNRSERFLLYMDAAFSPTDLFSLFHPSEREN